MNKQPLIEYKNNSHRHNYTQNLELWLSMIRGLNMGHNNENTIENILLYKTLTVYYFITYVTFYV